MKVKVIKSYRDKYNKTLHRSGEILTIAKERYEEINSTSLGVFVKEIEKEKPSTKPKKKKK